MKQIAIKIVNKSPTVKPIVLTECSIFDFEHFKFYQRWNDPMASAERIL